jgi:lactate dehydrogenase-like 2-hydroxyacid dehydrogenase
MICETSKMKPDLLIIPALPLVAERLGGPFTVHRLGDYPDAAACFAALGERVRGIVTFSGAGLAIDRSVLERLPRLEIIANLGVGYESIDIEAARARGVIVTNAAGANAADVAEFAFGLLIDAARGIARTDRDLRAGRWPGRGMPRIRRVSGRPLGILGLGHIGLAVARRAEAFDMKVSYHNRRPRADVPYRYLADPLALVRAVDFLIVALPGGPETHHLVDRAIMDALGPEGVLVNVGRGSIVDEAALIEALSEGRLGAAGLDVFEHEPHVPPALAALPNVVLTPHQAGTTVEGVQAIFELALANLEAHFAGRPVLTAVG